MSCYELQNLNHLDNQVTYQTKLKSSMDCTKANKYEGKRLRQPRHALSAYVSSCSNHITR